MDVSKQYITKINRVIDFIESNIGCDMTLEELARVADFSKYHFNRIFHSFFGETPFRFITRLRLEKAASQMLTNRNKTISEIAYGVGFSDISVFSRNFKNHFQKSPTEFLKSYAENSNLGQAKSNFKQHSQKSSPYFCHHTQTIKWRTNMDLNKSVEVKDLPKMTVAYVRNLGPWDGDQKKYVENRDKLFTWAAARGLMGGVGFMYLILYQDDPKVALSDKLRMSQCITIPPGTRVDGEIGKMEIDAARYAVSRFELTPPDFPKAWEWLYGVWLPKSGFEPDDKPYFETYPEEPKGDKFLVDFYVPVKPAEAY